MATINFYLRKKDAKEETPIILYISGDNKRFKVSIGEKIHPKYWHKNKQVPKSSYTGCIELNNVLEAFKDDALKVWRKIKANGEPLTSTHFKNKLEEERVVITEEEKSFLTILEGFIEVNQSIRAANTIQTYRTLQGHLIGFQKHTRYKLTFETVNLSFRDKFHRYLIEEKNLNDTSIQKNFAVLKRFMTYATENGYNQSIEYHQFRFKAAPSTKITLTEAELESIKNLDLSHKPYLDRVRDMFLFGCETSLRHSDLANLKPINVKQTIIDGEKEETNYLDLVAQKTRGEIKAPLSAFALELLEKHNDSKRNTCFPVISNQKFNSYIKEVGKLAGIDDPVTIVRFVGSKRNETHAPKYEHITTHTQRRTFITRYFERGGSIAGCMVYTGHKNYKELETYRDKTVQHKLKTAKNAFEPKFRKVI